MGLANSLKAIFGVAMFRTITRTGINNAVIAKGSASEIHKLAAKSNNARAAFTFVSSKIGKTKIPKSISTETSKPFQCNVSFIFYVSCFFESMYLVTDVHY